MTGVPGSPCRRAILKQLEELEDTEAGLPDRPESKLYLMGRRIYRA